MSTRYYLRRNVAAEPLFNQWYAWSLLIPPTTASMYIANSHLKIMQSYVSAPAVHMAAVNNPSMRGGPFIDYDGKRVDEIRALMQRTKEENIVAIEFAAAVKNLSEMLANEAKGFSLEALYGKVPELLRGYVELTYDLNNNPSFRFVEWLMYESPFYRPASQGIVLSLIEDDNRAFALSTPRLEDEEKLFLKLPFKHEAVDELFRMKETPESYASIKEQLGLEDKHDELFSTFLTEEEPPAPSRYAGEGIRIRYFGHACLLIETRDVQILTDPLISYDYPSATERYTFSDLPESIEYVLITHSHQDHLVLEALLQLRYKIKNIVIPRSEEGSLVDPSLKLALQSIGFRNVIELGNMESLPIPGGTLTGVPFFGEHADLNIRSKIAHLIRLGNASILCAADSSNVEPKLYEHVQKLIGDIDVLFLGMECDGAPLSWLYGPLLTTPLTRGMDHSRRLTGSDYHRAIDFVERFNCKQVYVYAMGHEPWLGFISSIMYTETSKPIVESNKLIENCKSRGIVAERLYRSKEIFI